MTDEEKHEEIKKERVRWDVVDKCFDEMDEVLVRHSKDNDMSIFEIDMIIALFQKKVFASTISSFIDYNTRGEDSKGSNIYG